MIRPPPPYLIICRAASCAPKNARFETAVRHPFIAQGAWARTQPQCMVRWNSDQLRDVGDPAKGDLAVACHDSTEDQQQKVAGQGPQFPPEQGSRPPVASQNTVHRAGNTSRDERRRSNTDAVRRPASRFMTHRQPDDSWVLSKRNEHATAGHTGNRTRRSVPLLGLVLSSLQKKLPIFG
jgi:hypothetical protein